MTAVAARSATFAFVIALTAVLVVGLIYLLVVNNSGQAGSAGDNSPASGTADQSDVGGEQDSTAAADEIAEAAPQDGADEPPAVEGPAPTGLVAVQGPVADGATYVSLSWSHIDAGSHPARSPRPSGLARGYDVEWDGQIVDSTDVDEEPWDDMAYRHDLTGGLSAKPDATYRVRTVFDDGPGPWSEPLTIDLLSDGDIGAVFVVDDYAGSDIEQAQQAVDDAEQSGGGIVVFGPRTYEFDEPLLVTGNGILLRGAGEDETIIRPGYAGGEDSCGPVTAVLLFRGRYEELEAKVGTEAPRGASTVTVDGATDLGVGDFIEFDGVRGQLPTYEYTELGIAQDPSTGRDLRYPFDAGHVVDITTNGDGQNITIDHPLSPFISKGSSLYRYTQGIGNGVELLTVEGAGPEDTSYYRLIDASGQIDFRVADVTVRWANRNFIDVSGHGITIVNLTGIDGGAVGFTPEACKYKVGVGPATNVTMVDSELGSLSTDENMSLITTQFLYRAVFRNTTLGQSRTYGFNEHGGGSRDVVVENNWIGAGPSGWSGILLGNDTWGFGGETAIRNNAFADNVIDVLMVENPHGVVIAGNRSTGCAEACITWSGWGGVHDGATAIDDPDDYGSARLTIAGNRFESDGDGLDLGVEDSNGFPWEGVRDVTIVDNQVIAPEGAALALRGDASSTGRLWIGGNEFTGELRFSEPGNDWWLWDNTVSGADSGTNSNDDSNGSTEIEVLVSASEAQDLPTWARLRQEWEHPGG